MPSKPDAVIAELRAQVRKVIDLAVETDHVAAPSRHHRLSAGGGEIDDRQTAMAEEDPRRRVIPVAVSIRPAVTNGVGHRRESRQTIAHGVIRSPETGNAAHY